MSETEKTTEKTKKKGMCGNCPVGLGFPVCWICVIAAAVIAVKIIP
jgi:hypothetical protein